MREIKNINKYSAHKQIPLRIPSRSLQKLKIRRSGGLPTLRFKEFLDRPFIFRFVYADEL